MSNSMKGMTAGLVATLVLSALMFLKGTMNIVPELNLITLLTSLGSIGRVAAWMDHFIIGVVVWGLLFSVYDTMAERTPYWLKGLIFGVFAWLLAMVLFMPLAKAGMFGLKLGTYAPIVMLAMHLIYGVVLGVTYGMLGMWVPQKAEEPRPAAAAGTGVETP